ncbi:MAG TPA: SDR family oxidoreductase, partial [Xanthobacteraceae bacterium]|nr:SDR family oxidoreductase [Xanthobacteraceae bacterium]
MRNVVVTGGSRGLGLGIVRRLAAAGYSAVAIARKKSDLLTSAIEEAGGAGRGAVHSVPFDLAEIDKIPDLVKSLRKD